jgi:hypothetical protein
MRRGEREKERERVVGEKPSWRRINAMPAEREREREREKERERKRERVS